MNKKLLLAIGLILLFVMEIIRIYFIMPFPGSQQSASVAFAYWMHNNIIWLRIILVIAVIYLFVKVFGRTRIIGKILFTLALIFYGIVFYYANFKFQADKMFKQPGSKVFKDASSNKVGSERLVLGVSINGEARAYPVQLIGYHHQVRDTIGNVPVMITYCTVCRTGRVFSPEINGKLESFRLVGMDHFNAMFEDATTKSWWMQATGISIAGKLKGSSLKELPSEQSTLASWLRKYPRSLILQPDTTFKKQYASLKDFDDGTTEDELEKRDSLSWKLKSWVIGIDVNGNSKAYDWNMLVDNRYIADSLPGMPLLITLEADSASFHSFNRVNKNIVLQFSKRTEDLLTDNNTGSTWNMSGLCVEGSLMGEQLSSIQSSQEFWHSWKTFHPRTAEYR